jgi:hypothetical protein
MRAAEGLLHGGPEALGLLGDIRHEMAQTLADTLIFH